MVKKSKGICGGVKGMVKGSSTLSGTSINCGGCKALYKGKLIDLLWVNGGGDEGKM